jgi:hypothetical protein
MAMKSRRNGIGGSGGGGGNNQRVARCAAKIGVMSENISIAARTRTCTALLRALRAAQL